MKKNTDLLNCIFTVYCLNRIEYNLSLVSMLLKFVDWTSVVYHLGGLFEQIQIWFDE